MKISVQKEQFAEVAKVAAILGDNGFNFAPEYFLAMSPYTIDSLRVYFQSGAIQAHMTLSADATTMGEGFCLPKNECMRFLEASNGEFVDIQVDGNNAKLKSGRSSMKAITLDMASFPLPDLDKAPIMSVQVSAKALQSALALAAMGTVSQSVNDSLGAYLMPDGRMLRIYSTDGKIMTHTAIEEIVLSGASLPEPVVIAMKTCQSIIKALNHLDASEMHIHFTDNDVVFSDVEHTWDIHCLKVANPKSIQFDRLLQAESSPICSITDNDGLEECLDISTSISNDKQNVVAMKVEDNVLTMALDNDRGQSKSAFDVAMHNAYQTFVPSLPIYAFLKFCRKYGQEGVIHIDKVNAPSAQPTRLTYTGDAQFIMEPTMVIAPYTA